jgi:LPXTG-site transpeptidase (sortase) family protein
MLKSLDRRVAIGAAISAVSAFLLAAGIFGIVSALSDDGTDLPSRGSLEQIVNDNNAGGNSLVETYATPVGPAPARFVIPRLYLDAPIIPLGVDASNSPQVPDRPDQVAWYTFSATPGNNSNAVFGGHVDWQTQAGVPIPGVFYRLRELQIGDDVRVTLADGAEVSYKVTGNVATAYDDPNVIKAMNPTSRDVITIITCGGTWLKGAPGPYGGNYSHRVVVRAERVAPAAAQALPGS